MSWLYTIVFVGMMFSNNSDSRYIQTVPTMTEPAPIVQPTPLSETDRLERSFPLNANGRVTVSNVNGSVNVMAWDRNEVKLVAVRRADTRENLDSVEIRIDARPEQFSVESKYGNERTWKTDSDGQWRKNDRVVVEYELTVPRTAVLDEVETVNGSVMVADFSNIVKVSAVNGMVKAINLRGAAELSTVNGEVLAEFDKLTPTSKIDLDTVNGRVNLVIPSDSNAVVKAESLNGPITNDFGLPSRRGKYVGNSLHGRLGNGGVSIKLESVNGSLSVRRRNDGRSLSPVTNLLPEKGEDDDGEIDSGPDPVTAAKVNRDIDRAVRQAQLKAMQDTQRELDRLKVQVPKIKAETLKDIDKSIDTKGIKESVRLGLENRRAALSGMRDAIFLAGIPGVETKTGTIALKGEPKITIDAKGCSVRVKGWDASEVKYSVARLGPISSPGPNVSESKTDNSVTIKVTEPLSSKAMIMGDSTHTRIDVFVPRKSNLKIISDAEIRLEGVSGELEISGADQPIDVRDSNGKLHLNNADGRARVIGFNGEIDARTDDGDIYLEGSITKLTANSQSGTVVVTLPSDANVDISTSTEPEAEGFTLSERGARSWRLGSGGPEFAFNSEDGRLILRNVATLSK